MKTLLLCAALSVSLSLYSQQQNLDTVKIHTVKVTSNIYMLKSSVAGNVGVLTGPEGILVIDDQFAPLSQKLMDAIKAVDAGQIRFVINTHIHGDHSGGNLNFKKAGAAIVAHSSVRKRFMEAQKQAAEKDNSWPQITFDEAMNFHLNGEDIQLLTFGPGHTDGDVIVHFKQSNVFHGGDAFVRYGYPYVDADNGGDFAGFINTLDKLLLVLDDNSLIIPGHGEVAKKSDVKKLRDTLTDLRDQVLDALKKGKKPEEISGMPFASKYDAQMNHEFLKGKDFVLMMATSLSKKR
jgi:cyclase